MTIDDFRYMRRGKVISGLTKDDMPLLEPVQIKDAGKDRALLVLHGFSSSPAVYRYLIPGIKNYNCIVCPVLPGHAESIESFSHSTAQQWLAKATEACQELVNTYEKVDVLGLSLGGLLAYELSQQFKLHHLYLLAPALKIKLPAKINTMIKFAQVLRCLGFKHLRSSAGNIVSDVNAEIAFRKLPISAIIEVFKLIHNYQWMEPTCPIDLFLGSHDEVVNSTEVEELFDKFPSVTIHWLHNSAHVLPIDNDLAEIIDCINTG